MSEVMVVLVTAGDDDEATRIAHSVVSEKLAACVNMISPIRSVYSWQGEVCDDREILLIMKTRTDRFPELRERIGKLHSYDVPEILAFSVSDGATDYLNWVRAATRRS